MVLTVAIVGSGVVSLACIAAGARRLWFAANATAIDPADVVRALGRTPEIASARLDALRDLVARTPAAEWERDLLEALSARQPARVALVNEQLLELDYRLKRWGRVPRVCASIALSAAFMLSALLLRQGLGDVDELSSDVGHLVTQGLVGEALCVVAVGFAGTMFCVGAHNDARRLVAARAKAADELVARLEEIREAEDAALGSSS